MICPDIKTTRLLSLNSSPNTLTTDWTLIVPWNNFVKTSVCFLYKSKYV